MGAGHSRYGHGGDVGEVAFGDLLDAVSDGLAREAGPVLDAGKALLFDAGDDSAVDQPRGGGVAVERADAEDAGVLGTCRRQEARRRHRLGALRYRQPLRRGGRNSGHQLAGFGLAS